MLALLPCLVAFALADDPVRIDLQIVRVAVPINAVTLYQGSAAVTRTAALPAAPGVYELRFSKLPASVQVDSLQARVAAPGKLLDVRYEEVPTPADDAATNPELAKIQADLEAVRVKRRDAAAKNDLVAAQFRALDAIVTKVSQGAARDVGGADLDPAKLKAQLDFMASERAKAMTQVVALDEVKRVLDEQEGALKTRALALGARDKVARTGVVVVALPEAPTGGTVDFTYLVRDATWRPHYSLRAASDLSGLDVEYDALIRQRTGEDWNDIALTLSTAQPARSASPLALDPIYVRKEMPVAKSVAAPASSPSRGLAARDGNGDGLFNNPVIAGERTKDFDAAAAANDATVAQNSTVATFSLPRTATFPSDASREQKTRIATVALKPEYVYVTRPAVDAEVYLRGKTRNDSAFQLLAGRATVFLGNDSVGAIAMPDVAPGGEVELWFGPDHRLTAKRSIVARTQSESGLISKSSDVAIQYKTELTNTMEKPVKIELWDRIPVSQDDAITVKLSDVQPGMVRDAAYENKERKQGLLKWVLELPARPTDRAATPVVVRWNVGVSWPKDTPISWFPE
ncbi:MAG: mucoidy inhibitor MuiA family protein [Phycisphaerae bacterium]|nr:mucoidy inhibitor MuiA family protein [Phycisphaerae bacterium]